MSKRFTDTEKWNDPWFRALSAPHKLFWSYLTDKCNAAGIWKVDIEQARFFIGSRIDPDAAVTAFGKRIFVISDEYWFLVGFPDFQYGRLQPDVRPHAAVIAELQKRGVWERVSKGYLEGINTHKDKEKEKDKEKGGAGENKRPTLEDVRAYCKERANNVDPEKWLAYYESNGWRVGKNPMKDWKAAVRTWEKSEFNKAPAPSTLTDVLV
jgi:hypothetical protein